MGDPGTQLNPGMLGAWLTKMHHDMMNLHKESVENINKTHSDSCATMLRSVAERFAQFELDDDTGPRINTSVRDMVETLFDKIVPDAVVMSV